MESAKTQNLWPDFSLDEKLEHQELREDGFVLREVPTFSEPKTEINNIPETPFSLEKGFFSQLLSDYGVKKEIEELIQLKANEIIQARWNEERQKIEAHLKETIEKGYQEGLQKGFEETEKKYIENLKKLEEDFSKKKLEYWDDFSKKFNPICDEVLGKKEELVVDHEKVWIKAIKNIFFRFRIPKHLEINTELEGWITQSVKEFKDNKKINIYLSKVEYEKFNELPDAKERKWNILLDPDLKEGESRFECDGAGIFYSSSQEAQKLEELINRFL